MQILIVLSAMLFVAVTPYLARWEAPDMEWSDEASGSVLGADLADADEDADQAGEIR